MTSNKIDIDLEKKVKKQNLVSFLAALLLLAMAMQAQDIFDAVRADDLDSIKALIERNPQIVYEKDDQKSTPLHWAVKVNHPEILKYLIEKGADVNALDMNNYTPLGMATERRQLALIKTLISAGADVNLKGASGWPPLRYSIYYNYLEAFEIIVNQGADLNEKDYVGKTPLYFACMGDREGILKTLLLKGAKINETDLGGNTPLHTAVYYGDIKAVDLLMDSGADIHVKNNFGQTPLHQAAASGYCDIAYKLLMNGAPAESKDNNGKTPLDLAQIHNNKKLVDRLCTILKQKNCHSPVNDVQSDLKKKLKPGEAIIWHLGNCGWAIKTMSKLLVFDYWNYGAMPDEPSLANGHISRDEIKGLDICFFVTHAHIDHYDKIIFEFANSSPNVKYIFGWKEMDNPNYTCFTDTRQSKVIDGIEINNICYDSESAFLVKTDGITIYHSGDYWGEYESDYEYLANKQKNIDVSFQNFPEDDIGIHAIEKFMPKAMFPMHSDGFEYLLQLQVNAISQKFPHTRFIAIKNKGDRYFYSNGHIEWRD